MFFLKVSYAHKDLFDQKYSKNSNIEEKKNWVYVPYFGLYSGHT